MDITQEYLDIRMIREHLDDIPPYSLSAGHSIRRFQPGDQKSWYRIHLLADKYTDVTPALFEKEFGTDAQRLAERQCFLIDKMGTPIGTASAWFDDLGEESLGRVHWVAIVPTEHGKGLAKPLQAHDPRLGRPFDSESHLAIATKHERVQELERPTVANFKS